MCNFPWGVAPGYCFQAFGLLEYGFRVDMFYPPKGLTTIREMHFFTS